MTKPVKHAKVKPPRRTALSKLLRAGKKRLMKMPNVRKR